MKTIEAQKIIGVRVWRDDENYDQATGFMLDQKAMNKCKLLEFKNLKELKEFVSNMNDLKKIIVDAGKRRQELAAYQNETSV